MTAAVPYERKRRTLIMAETVDENKDEIKNENKITKSANVRFYLISAAIFAGVCGFIIAVDQITKAVIHGNIFYGSSIVLIPGLLEISHVHNTGAAWGIFNQHTGLLSAVTLFACALLCFLYMESRQKLFRAALLMVIGGAIGNLIDRIARGYVIDFIRVWIFKYEFPNKNNIKCVDIILKKEKYIDIKTQIIKSI